MLPVRLRQYKRGFCNKGGRWDNKSVATLFKTGEESDYVEGIALRMTKEEVAKLDVFEGYPQWYDRQVITLEALSIEDGQIAAKPL